jgi:uncharacterized NAD-dependent epimerase/dehydratase family protein
VREIHRDFRLAAARARPNNASIANGYSLPKYWKFRAGLARVMLQPMIPQPYLLYLGNETDPLSVKTSRGLAQWRPQLCVGQFRGPRSAVSLDLEDLTFVEAVKRGAKTLILGIANAGGTMDASIVADVIAALEAGLHVASGLHARLRNEPAIAAAAARLGRKLFDVRDPPPDLPIGKGTPRAGRRLLTVGTDCSVGKMYTTLAIEKEMHARGMKADFRATGQTGILIAGSGVPVDAVVSDFLSGSVEWLSPARHDCGWDLIEGQGSLFHPSFAGVSLGLLHGAQPDAIVLCHEIGREHIRGLPGRPMPDLAECLAENLRVAKVTSPNAQAVGVALNTSCLSTQEAQRTCDAISRQLQLPCSDPMRGGVGSIVDQLTERFELAQRSTA